MRENSCCRPGPSVREAGRPEEPPITVRYLKIIFVDLIALLCQFYAIETVRFWPEAELSPCRLQGPTGGIFWNISSTYGCSFDVGKSTVGRKHLPLRYF